MKMSRDLGCLVVLSTPIITYLYAEATTLYVFIILLRLMQDSFGTEMKKTIKLMRSEEMAWWLFVYMQFTHSYIW